MLVVTSVAASVTASATCCSVSHIDVSTSHIVDEMKLELCPRLHAHEMKWELHAR